MRTLDSTCRRVLVPFVALLAGGLIAACGGSSSSSSTRTAAANAGGPSTARRAALRKCLTAHGVTLPARPPGGAPGGGGAPPGAGGPPPGGGGGFFGGGAGGGAASNPKVRAALQACGAGNFGAGRPRQFSPTAINSYVACVRQHGYNLPSPNLSGKGAVFPSTIRSNPAFQAASRACQSLLFPNRGAGGTSSTA